MAIAGGDFLWLDFSDTAHNYNLDPIIAFHHHYGELINDK
jgi:hypothetical protein